MPVPTRIYNFSSTPGSNSPSGTESIGTGLDDYLRALQAVVRGDLATFGANIASATTTDIGAIPGLAHAITGTTTITSFGTVESGVVKILVFNSSLTLTHNATSLILPGAANITAASSDVAIFISQGSGNWRCISFTKASIPPGAFPPGTRIIFQQTSAPTGWTKITTFNDVALRLVSGTASSGGTTVFSTVFGTSKTTGGSIITQANLPSFSMVVQGAGQAIIDLSNSSGSSDTVVRGGGSIGAIGFPIDNGSFFVASGGSGTTHNHTLSLDLAYADVIIASKT